MSRSAVAMVLAGCLLVAPAGCDRTPAQPTPAPQPNPNPTPEPSPSWTLSGTVVTTLTGEPIPGASLTFSGVDTVVANGAGEWTLTRPAAVTTQILVEVTAPGHVPRAAYVAGSAASRAGLRIDMIRDSAPFSLTFYRQFVRNAYDDPDLLRTLRRWTQSPSVYVDIRNPRTGELTMEEIDSIREAAAETIPLYSGGRFTLDRFEFGAASRPETPGWINVNITYDPAGNYCGRARVGSNPGVIDLNYDRCASECGSAKLGPRTIRHEFGHAMGFFHVADPQALLHPDPATRGPCRGTEVSDSERQHGRIAYERSIGNADIDRDPSTSALILVPATDTAIVSCYRLASPSRR